MYIFIINVILYTNSDHCIKPFCDVFGLKPTNLNHLFFSKHMYTQYTNILYVI